MDFSSKPRLVASRPRRDDQLTQSTQFARIEAILRPAERSLRLVHNELHHEVFISSRSARSPSRRLRSVKMMVKGDYAAARADIGYFVSKCSAQLRPDAKTGAQSKTGHPLKHSAQVRSGSSRRDMSLHRVIGSRRCSGQGAPLAAAFHYAVDNPCDDCQDDQQ